jgi:hypothetical protein
MRTLVKPTFASNFTVRLFQNSSGNTRTKDEAVPGSQGGPTTCKQAQNVGRTKVAEKEWQIRLTRTLREDQRQHTLLACDP